MKHDVSLSYRVLRLINFAEAALTTQIQEATGAPGSSVSQQLAVLRSRNILATERRGTTIIYRVADAELFDLLDVARRVFNAHLSDTIHLLRLVDRETVAAGEG